MASDYLVCTEMHKLDGQCGSLNVLLLFLAVIVCSKFIFCGPAEERVVQVWIMIEC